MSLKDLPLPSIASLRAIAALRSPHLALVRPARIGLGFESAGVNQKTLLDVEDLLGGPGRLSLPYSLRWILDVMTGLSVLHRTLSFVHGEVQPEHIVLGEDGVGRLLPVVRAHWVRGEERAPERLYYLAPEKLLGDGADVRSDVYSVGVLLWEALAGQRMLEVVDVDDILARLMSGGIPRAQAPEGESWTAPLSAVAARALSVDPERRFATVAEMKDAIESACSRYLASAPGMAELFGNPALRARNLARESRPPDSQRVTLPPNIMPGSTPYASEDALDAAAERLSRSSMSSIDLEEELTTRPRAASPPQLEATKVAPMRAPHLDVTKVAHVPAMEVTKVAPKPHQSTLLGVPPPFVERDSSPPDELTIPRGRISIPPTAPVVLTPLPPAPAPLAKQPSMPPRSITPPQSFAVQPTAQSLPSAHGGFARPASAPPEPNRRAASLAPLVAAPVAYEPPAPLEPSFELVKPRKRRGALWLVLGAAAAVGLFAARPWLMQQVAAATGAAADTATENGEPAPTTPLVTSSATIPVTRTAPSASDASAAPAIGIASTPPVPTNAGRARAGEDHIVIHDTVEPSLRELAHPTPAATPAAPAPMPPPAAAPPPAPPSPPPSPPPAARPKEVPVSDADRYGI
ncbi:MAG TPA: protein kinase [Polyangiaceae bacterium]|nr:protein kinase [Polyangiaceae bacterium]